MVLLQYNQLGNPIITFGNCHLQTFLVLQHTTYAVNNAQKYLSHTYITLHTFGMSKTALPTISVTSSARARLFNMYDWIISQLLSLFKARLPNSLTNNSLILVLNCNKVTILTMSNSFTVLNNSLTFIAIGSFPNKASVASNVSNKLKKCTFCQFFFWKTGSWCTAIYWSWIITSSFPEIHVALLKTAMF